MRKYIMDNELTLLTKAVNNLVLANNDDNSEHHAAASDYFSNYLTVKTNRKVNDIIALEK